MNPLDPTAFVAAYGMAGLIAFVIGFLALWLLLMAACYVFMLLPAAWLYKSALRVGSIVFGYPLDIPGENSSFTFWSGFAGWAALYLITFSVGIVQGQSEPVIPAKLLMMFVIMATGPAVYAIARGYMGKFKSTAPEVA